MKFFYKKTSLVSDKQVQASGKKLLPYMARLQDVAKKNNYEDPECSINCPFDKKIIKRVKDLAKKKVSKKLKYIIVIGIGGSNLGTKAVYDAMQGFFDVLQSEAFPKMIFVDTNNARALDSFKTFAKKHIKHADEVLICSVSKSGGTAETIANTEIIIDILKKKHKNITDRLVVITNKDSLFWNAAVGQGIDTLAIPELVGGRYSVLSAVGLFPLAAAGFNIDELLKGARKMRKTCLQKDIKKNPAALSAAILYLQMKKGRSMNDNFIFHSELESIGKWYRQLMGESIGKEKNIHGKVVHAGLTPTVSIGSTDLHSVGQLYLGGPKDKVTTFIYTKKVKDDSELPRHRLFNNLVSDISHKSAQDILDAILQGVKIAYTKKRLPFCEVVLNSVSLSSIGAFFQFKMIEMMYLGTLLEVNTFDQPNVESYKLETKKILNN